MSRPDATRLRAAKPGARITLAHGSGGKAMRDLVENVLVSHLVDPELSRMDDQARLDLAEFTARGDRLAMTTDSFVVDPLFFRGGDIGKLAVCGTVNDLAVGGATPLFLTCSLILEEGLEIALLESVVASIRDTATTAGVRVVTGDTKVVARGQADKLFINTAGVGVIAPGVDPRAKRIRAGDRVIVNGPVGDHGAAIADARGELGTEHDIASDCRPLNHLVDVMLKTCSDIRAMRDATRGGVATVLGEFAESAGACIRIDEAAVPLRDNVRGLCELLGLDPLYLANEGTLVAVVPPDAAQAVLAAMRRHEDGRESAIVGEVFDAPRGRVILETRFGGERIVDRLVGEQLPRIC